MNQKIIPSINIKDINWEKCWFNPGCAMSIYKPELIDLMLTLLRKQFGDVKYHNVCCHHNPCLPEGATLINNCAGCDRRFRAEYPGIQTITFRELLDSAIDLSLPDYEGLSVSVHDSCSFRQKPQVHTAVRNILRKMNIEIVESKFSGMKSICCGDNFYSHIPNEQVAELQKKRAPQMPCANVVVYCIGCVRTMTVGGKQPLYLLDPVFGNICFSVLIKSNQKYKHIQSFHIIENIKIVYFYSNSFINSCSCCLSFKGSTNFLMKFSLYS